jgi:ABC-type transport system substrate-binding protein
MTDGSIWVADQYSGTVSRIDSRDDRVMATTVVGGQPDALAVLGRKVWTGVVADGATHHGGTLVIVTPWSITSTKATSNSSIDPAFYNVAGVPQLMGLAYDTLVTFDHSPGATGVQLVPDLAESIPTPSDGGRVHTFRLRSGIRYSDGQPLRAEDFRRAVASVRAPCSGEQPV